MTEIIHLDPKQITLTDSVIGKGAFGEVIVAQWRNSDVAYKRSHLMDNDDSQPQGTDMTQEIEVLSKLRHPNLVLFIGVVNDAITSKMAIVTELMPCSLYDILEVKKVSIELPFLLDIALDIANGLDYLHRHDPPIVHRDISSKNILIKGNHAKIADLGQAKLFQHSVMSRQTGMPGAMAYSAPEVLTGRYSTKIDIFSYGILFCQLCTGEYPRIDKRDDQIQNAQKKYPMFTDMITSTVNFQPTERLDAKLIGEYLMTIKGNDRYYPPSRHYLPENEIGVLSSHWMKEQIQIEHAALQLQVEQKEKLMIAEQVRWKQEATKYDTLLSTHQLLQAQSQHQETKYRELQDVNRLLQQRYERLTQDKQQLEQEKTNIQNELQTSKHKIQQFENEVMFQHVMISEKQSMFNQAHQQYQQAKDQNQELQNKLLNSTKQYEHLTKQATIQQEYTQDLEQRLELILVRWKEEKFKTQQEVQKYTKLNQQYSQVMEEKEKLTKELQRCEGRLILYEGLPLPDEIKLRLSNMQEDYQRLRDDYLRLEDDHNELQHLKLDLEDQVLEKSQYIEQLNDLTIKQGNALQSKDSQLEELKTKTNELTQKLSEMTDQCTTAYDENKQLQTASKQMLDELNSLTKTLLSTKQQHDALLQAMQSMDTITQVVTDATNNASVAPIIPSSNQTMSVAAPSGAMNMDIVLSKIAAKEESSILKGKVLVPKEEAEMSDIAVKHLIERSTDQHGANGLILLLQTYKDERIIWRALRSLRECILKNEQERMQLLDSLSSNRTSSSSSAAHAVDVWIVRLLQDYPTSDIIQGQCARLVGTLSFGNDIFRRKVGEKHIFVYFIQAMKEFLHHADTTVLLHICTAITNLTHGSHENRSRFLEGGGIPMVIQIMRTHVTHAKLQCQCCWVILTLAGSDEVALVISTQGGDLAIIQAMLQHATDAGVQQYGCWAIHNLALAHEDVANNLKRRGALEVCKIATENHFDNEDVIKQAKTAMTTLTTPSATSSSNHNGNHTKTSLSLPALTATTTSSGPTSQKMKKKLSSK